MKQIYFLFVVLLVVMAACGGKKETSVDAEQLMFQIDSVDHVTGLQRMQVSRIDQYIVSGGKKYNLFIERAPSDSLPSVKSDLGIFADNRIVVRISRENGSRVFAKTFTKQSFSGFVSADHLRHFILEGVVFDEDLLADAGHDAHTLRLNEDLTLGALLAADGLAESIVGTAEPCAVPTGGQGGLFHGINVLAGGSGLLGQI